MKITKRGSIWIAQSSYEERAIPKAAGFWWHGPGCYRKNCPACEAGIQKQWWTSRAEIAAKLSEHADDSCREDLTQAKSQRDHALESSRAVDTDIEIPAPDGCEYLPFQRAGIAYAMGRPSTLIGDEMGLGKTIQAIGVINSDPSIRSILILCPATLRLNWSRESEKWLVTPRKIRVIEKRETPDQADEIVIVNYDKLVGKAGQAMRDALMARNWDLLISDESHFLKNRKAQRTVAVLGKPGRKGQDRERGLIDCASRKLFLTGTPILNRPIEIHPLLAALCPQTFGNFFSFAKRYCNAKKGRWGWDFSGSSNLGELQEKLRTTVMVRRLKKDVLTDLPTKRRQVIELSPNGSTKHIQAEQEAFSARQDHLEELAADAELAKASGDTEAYKAAVERLREGYRVAFEEISRMRHELAVAKAPRVVEHVQGMLDDGVEKIIVFAHHKDVVAALMEGLSDASPVKITGDTPMEDRQAAVDRFQNDPSCKVFVGNLRAAGVGITLTAAAHVVFAELDWVPANMTQAEDRAHRIGQTNSVLIQHLVFDGSLDAQMAKTLVSKQAVADKALDDEIPDLQIPVMPTAKGRNELPTAKDVLKGEITQIHRDAALRAMRDLAGICDGARAKDGSGFNRFDSRIGHSLAECANLNDGQTRLAARLARKYRGQLSDHILTALEIERR